MSKQIKVTIIEDGLNRNAVLDFESYNQAADYFDERREVIEAPVEELGEVDDHVITEEDLETNPGMAEAGLEAGDKVGIVEETISVSSTDENVIVEPSSDDMPENAQSDEKKTSSEE